MTEATNNNTTLRDVVLAQLHYADGRLSRWFVMLAREEWDGGTLRQTVEMPSGLRAGDIGIPEGVVTHIRLEDGPWMSLTGSEGNIQWEA